MCIYSFLQFFLFFGKRVAAKKITHILQAFIFLRLLLIILHYYIFFVVSHFSLKYLFCLLSLLNEYIESLEDEDTARLLGNGKARDTRKVAQ